MSIDQVSSETSLEIPINHKIKILIIDDDEAEFLLVSELLREREHLYDLKWVDSLAKGISSVDDADVIILDLFLGDSRGLDTFIQMKSHVKEKPIIILSGLDDEGVAVEAIQKGAQDFLVKDHVDGDRLSRVIQYALKRSEIKNDPKNIGLIDPLTGLYNRQGFLVMAEQYLKGLQRNRKEFLIYFAVLEEYSQIASDFGKSEADHAVLLSSEILRESFRASDLIWRIGDDEFAILAIEYGNLNPKIVSSRIKNNQKYCNAKFNLYRLSLSMSVSLFDFKENSSVQELLTKIDQVFNDYKSRKNIKNFFPTN